MVKAIIFDCFGVLLTDALTNIVSNLHSSNPEKAARITATVKLASSGHIHAAQSRKAVASELGLNLDEYSQQIREGEVKNTELFELIKEIRKSYKTALLSNIISGGLEVRFPNNELDQYFDVVVASGDTGTSKPDPKIYELTCRRLGVLPNEAAMVDDTQKYLDGAASTGLKTILYTDMGSFTKQLNKLLDSNY